MLVSAHRRLSWRLCLGVPMAMPVPTTGRLILVVARAGHPAVAVSVGVRVCTATWVRSARARALAHTCVIANSESFGITWRAPAAAASWPPWPWPDMTRSSPLACKLQLFARGSHFVRHPPNPPLDSSSTAVPVLPVI